MTLASDASIEAALNTRRNLTFKTVLAGSATAGPIEHVSILQIPEVTILNITYKLLLISFKLHHGAKARLELGCWQRLITNLLMPLMDNGLVGRSYDLDAWVFQGLLVELEILLYITCEWASRV